MTDSTVWSPGGNPPFEHSSLEIVTAVVLGVATVAIAWAAYQASLRGGIQDSRLTESVLKSNESVDEAQRVDTAESFALFEAASEANENGDGYVLASTWLAAVLFLAGISNVFRSRRNRSALLTASIVILVASSVYVATLPNAIGA